MQQDKGGIKQARRPRTSPIPTIKTHNTLGLMKHSCHETKDMNHTALSVAGSWTLASEVNGQNGQTERVSIGLLISFYITTIQYHGISCGLVFFGLNIGLQVEPFLPSLETMRITVRRAHTQARALGDL